MNDTDTVSFRSSIKEFKHKNYTYLIPKEKILIKLNKYLNQEERTILINGIKTIVTGNNGLFFDVRNFLKNFIFN